MNYNEYLKKIFATYDKKDIILTKHAHIRIIQREIAEEEISKTF
ncbi:MAG: hypothetical protein ACMXYK_03480 [Candidatus Woesearchaeota archaeon]